MFFTCVLAFIFGLYSVRILAWVLKIDKPIRELLAMFTAPLEHLGYFLAWVAFAWSITFTSPITMWTYASFGIWCTLALIEFNLGFLKVKKLRTTAKEINGYTQK